MGITKIKQKKEKKDKKANKKKLTMRSNFKSSKSFEERVRESHQIKEEHGDKTAVIVERAPSEKNLPVLDKSKFLVPSTVTLHELTRVIRRRLELAPGQALFLMTHRGMPAGTQSLAELWETDGDEDGFLYFSYAAQETFGCRK